MTAPRRRLADRYIEQGTVVAREFADADRLDPDRPTLAMIVAQVIAQAEERGREQERTRVRTLIGQRTALRNERERLGRRWQEEGNLPPAVSEFRWVIALDEQIAALRTLLDSPSPVDGPAGFGEDQRA